MSHLTSADSPLAWPSPWQPLATVPRDGTFVLVTCGGIYCPAVAKWNTEEETWEDGDGEYELEGEWPLTHWMPLPQPPTNIPV